MFRKLFGLVCLGLILYGAYLLYESVVEPMITNKQRMGSSNEEIEP